MSKKELKDAFYYILGKKYFEPSLISSLSITELRTTVREYITLWPEDKHLAKNLDLNKPMFSYLPLRNEI